MTEQPCTNWNAWIDLMPGKEPTLHVTASCTFPTNGYEASLKKADPQGANPRDLLLELKLDEPSGVANEVITEVPLAYREPVNGPDFDSVSIRPNGPEGIEVKITQ